MSSSVILFNKWVLDTLQFRMFDPKNVLLFCARERRERDREREKTERAAADLESL